jgi:hypothetical protein
MGVFEPSPLVPSAINKLVINSGSIAWKRHSCDGRVIHSNYFIMFVIETLQ